MIKAEIICDSISPNGDRITTFILEYPRFIHAELMTHKMFATSGASSRAIPIAKMHANIMRYTALPVYWGANKPGMSADVEILNKEVALSTWLDARDSAIEYSKLLDSLGVHKQLANRVTEPFSMMKIVRTGTEWANFFHLRAHKDAQPEFQVLALQMQECYNNNMTILLEPGQWHLPYVPNGYKHTGKELEISKKMSAACCAAVSYRNENMTIEKAEEIFERLITSTPVHASPCEHQATPMSFSHSEDKEIYLSEWDEGTTHMRNDYSLWSAQFKGWIQFRQLLKDHTVW